MLKEYFCLRCNHHFPVEISETELRGSLASNRAETCPKCAQPVGTGPIHCRHCSNEFVLDFPHQHVGCDVARGDCPVCGKEYVSLCVC